MNFLIVFEFEMVVSPLLRVYEVGVFLVKLAE